MNTLAFRKTNIRFGTLILIVSFFIPLSCQKKVLGHVEVTGRVLNSFTNDPEGNVRVVLEGDDATSAKEQTKASITLVTIFTSEDGTFKLRSKPSKRGNYYLSVTGSRVGKQKIDVKENKRFNFGDCFTGSKEFYCKVKVVSKSDSGLRLQKTLFLDDFYTFEKGTNTEVLLSRTIDGEVFKEGVDFRIYYTTYSNSPGHYGTNHILQLPVKSQTDTLYTTIYY